MNRRQIVWITPIVAIGAIGLATAFLYPLEVTEYREEIAETQEFLEQRWILQTMMIDGEEIPLSPERMITLRFDKDILDGSGGCNTYSGGYDATGEYRITATNAEGFERLIGVGGTISTGQIASTERACLEPGLMEQEGLFFTALNRITSFEVSPDTLKLTTQDGETVLNFDAE